MSYRVTVDGRSWLTDELTLDEACAIEEELGLSWHSMEPINSAKHAKAIIARLMTHVANPAECPTLDAAKRRVGCMTITEVLECISLDAPAKADEGEAPKAEGEPNPSQSENSPQV